jgi:hypothetical protein
MRQRRFRVVRIQAQAQMERDADLFFYAHGGRVACPYAVRLLAGDRELTV